MLDLLNLFVILIFIISLVSLVLLIFICVDLHDFIAFNRSFINRLDNEINWEENEDG